MSDSSGYPSPSFEDGRRVGHILLGKALGEGGMGTVVQGWDKKLHRRVAVKAVAPHVRGDEVARRRFRREARILSRLEHPNVCRIYELLEEEDGDLLVLELIEGRTLREVLAGGPLSRRRGLEIAIQLAEALIAAHARGIVHRDLKPANVMVGDDGIVKVFDFGLALSAERSLEMAGSAARLEAEDGSSTAGGPATEGDGDPLEDSRVTSVTRGSILGTLAYMSPEQARSEAATSASDMYALGVILQEMFTGERPSPRSLPVHLQLSRIGRGERQPVEGLDPDLTSLVDRLLSAAPGARPSAVDVADRLRWIQDSPRRRVRRLASIVLVAGLLVVVALLALQRDRIAEEAARANREASAAREVSEFLVELFEVSDPWSGEAGQVTARELLDRGAEKIRTELEDQPGTRARLLATIGRVHRQLGEFDDARTFLEEAFGLVSKGGEDELERARLLVRLAEVDTDQGNLEEAERRFEEAIGGLRASLGVGEAEVARAIHLLGYVRFLRGEWEAADRAYEEALEMLREVEGPRSPTIAEVIADRALLAQELGEEQRAEELHLRALEMREAILPPDHPSLGISYANLAAHYYLVGRYSEAISLFERDLEIATAALGPEHRDVAISHNNLGTILRDMGSLPEARRHLERSLEIRRARLGEDHAALGVAHHALGSLYREMGRHEEAERQYLRSQQIWEEALGPEHPNLATSLAARGELYLLSGRPDEAEALLRRSVAIRREHYGEDHHVAASAETLLAEALASSGRLDEARKLLDRDLRIVESGLAADPEHNRLRLLRGQILVDLSRVASRRGDRARAEELLREAVEILGPLARTTENASFDTALVLALLGLERVDEARPIALELVRGGWRRADLVAACREHGIELPSPEGTRTG